MDNPIRLDDLSLSEMRDIGNVIEALSKWGGNAQMMGYDPRFDLRPGFPVRMTLDYRLPMAAPMVSGLDLATGPDVTMVTEMSEGAKKTAELRCGFLKEFTPRPALEVKTEAEDLTLQGAELSLDPAPLTAADIDAAVSGAFIAVTGRDPKPVATYDDEDAADPAPVQPAAKLETATILAPSDAKPAPWTEEEDKQLVFLVARSMGRDGMKKGAAIAGAAKVLNRPIPGTEFHMRSLADDLAKALRAYDRPAAPDEPGANTADSGGGADPSPAAPIAAPSTPTNTLAAATLSPIEQHLLNMPTKGGWTLELDRELLQLAEDGWKMADIALDMGRDAKAVQDRFDLLTGWDRDAKTRKYTRVALLIAAEGWCAKTRAAAE